MTYARGQSGQFSQGNKDGPGNPHAKQAGMLRKAMFDAVTPEDMRAITHVLVEEAKGGNVQAIRELILRTLGKPIEADLLQRLEEIELKLELALEPKVTGVGRP